MSRMIYIRYFTLDNFSLFESNIFLQHLAQFIFHSHTYVVLILNFIIRRNNKLAKTEQHKKREYELCVCVAMFSLLLWTKCASQLSGAGGMASLRNLGILYNICYIIHQRTESKHFVLRLKCKNWVYPPTPNLRFHLSLDVK
jgi:hypothetical protein